MSRNWHKANRRRALFSKLNAASITEPLEIRHLLAGAPTAPAIASLERLPSVQGEFDFRISGTAEVNSLVTVEQTSVGVVGQVTAGAGGAWTVDVQNSSLSNGRFDFYATATNVEGSSPASPSRIFQPNIVIVNTDDMRLDDLAYLPFISTTLASEGTVFNDAFAPTSLCGPSRATLMTGLLAHRTGIFENLAPLGGAANLDLSSSLPVWLDNAGYQTGLFGKDRTLAGQDALMPSQSTLPQPPGWDEYFTMLTGVNGYAYNVLHNGVAETYGRSEADYATDVLSQKLTGFVDSASTDAPFFAYVAAFAPHYPYVPAQRHLGTYSNIPSNHSPSFNIPEPGKEAFDEAYIQSIDDSRERALEALLSVDDLMANLYSDLQNRGILDNTVLIFMSDHGTLRGEHAITDKRLFYEESARIPLVVWDGRQLAHSTSDAMVLSTDIAPTLAWLGGATITTPNGVDGKNLTPLLQSPAPSVAAAFREDFLMENWQVDWNPDTMVNNSLVETAVRNHDWVYATRTTGDEYLFDLNNDPFQLNNLANDPAHAAVKQQLINRLEELKPADQVAPVATSVTASVSPASANGLRSVRIQATVTDVGYGDSQIRTPEYFFVPNGDPGTGLPLDTLDGQFNSSTEVTYLDISWSDYIAAGSPSEIYLRFRDLPGNWSPIQAVPITGLLPTLSLDATSDTGASNSDGLTMDSTPTFRGTASIGGSEISLYAIPMIVHTVPIAPIFLGTTLAAANGEWESTTTFTVAGRYAIAAVQNYTDPSPSGGTTTSLFAPISYYLLGVADAAYSVSVVGTNESDIIDINSLTDGSAEFLLNGVSAGSLPGISSALVVAGAGDDVITVNGSIDTTFQGGAGSDVLNGGSGNDRFYGGGGSDLLRGGAGDDVYLFDCDFPQEFNTIDESGGGYDVLDFRATRTQAISINLSLTGFQPVNMLLGLQLLSGNEIEGVFGGALGDTIIGNSLNNTLRGGGGPDILDGGAGNDSLYGGGDDDVLIGGEGNDLLQGDLGNDTYIFGAVSVGTEADTVWEYDNQGSDTLDFGTLTSDIAVRLWSTAAQDVHTGRTLTLNSGSAFDNVIGGSGNDTLIGNNSDNRLTGNAGNDTFYGKQGSDTLLGGLGDDWYTFEVIAPGEADSVIEYAGEGTDTLDFASETIDVTLDLSSTSIQDVQIGRTLQLNSGSTFENIIGGSGNDTLTGNSLNNVLTGNAGNDTYVFGAVSVGTEVDTVREFDNQGTDTLDFGALTSDIAVRLWSTAAQNVHTGRTLTLNSGSSFENIVGGSGNDTLIGNSLNNRLTGNAGNDTLYGKQGSDTLLGGLGDDWYTFEVISPGEADSVIEYTGEGTDTLNFYSETIDVTLDLSSTSIQNVQVGRTLQLNSGSTFENVIGGSGNDTLTGNSLNNVLTGNAGNDTYVFRAVSVGTEVDTVREFDNQGTDTLDFSALTSGIIVRLWSTAAQNVHTGRTLTLNSGSSFENIVGGSGNDTLIGNSLNNRLTGNAGNDTLYGKQGSDTLLGGLGDDWYTFEVISPGEADSVIEYTGEGTDTLNFYSETIDVTLDLSSTSIQNVQVGRTLQLNSGSTFENVIGGSGNDTLTGNSLNNVLTGNAGNDTYVFRAVSVGTEVDTVREFDNQGTDTLDFGTLTSDITVRLGSTVAENVHTGRTLTLNSGSSFENIVGGSGNDTLVGNSLNNQLTGNAGNDTLYGKEGSDTLVGGLGDDWYTFGVLVPGEADNVIEYAGEGTDTLNFYSQAMDVTLDLNSTAIQNVHTGRTLQLNSGSTFENIIGGSGNDTLTGNSLNNVLTGNTGNDTYVFGAVSVGSEVDTVREFDNQGTDTLDFGTLTSDIAVRLWSTAAQNVHTGRTLTLNSGSSFENIVGGSGNDTLVGNSLNNQLTGNAGNDTLYGKQGSDTLLGGLGDDWYTFEVISPGEADSVIEYAGEGTDTLNFYSQTIDVTLDLSSTSIQNVQTGRALQLNSGSTFENAVGGSGNDTLIGNSLNNVLKGIAGANILVGGAGNDQLFGGSSNDLLIGGLGLDIVNGGNGDDILIAGVTTSDNLIINLNDIRTEWTSAGTYTERVANLRSGVGTSGVSLEAGINVLNDGGEVDILTGSSGEDWYLKALDDLITDLVSGELVDQL
jgi:Ca2+-binding RTX toxin-like protein/arylsulfatase A-like enzyme